MYVTIACITVMKISVSKRRTQASEIQLEHALGKVENLEHYFPDGIFSLDVVLDSEKERQIVEIVAHLVRKKTIKASGESEDFNVAVDMAVEKFKAQLVKYKEQLQDKRTNPPPEVEPQPSGNSEEGYLSRTRVYIRKPMTPEEAILQLEAYQKKDFLIFMDVDSERISVLHRLSEGKYELLEPVL